MRALPLARKGLDAEGDECIRTLYQQVPNSFVAASVVTLYMIASAWPFSRHGMIALWATVQIGTQILRGLIYLSYRRTAPKADQLQIWALAYSGYMLVAGLVWGLSAFLFIHVEQPMTLALVLCGLYGISAGSVPGNAYNPLGCYTFVVTIFAMVSVKMVITGGPEHLILGAASGLFALVMVLFCRVQNRALRDGFAIRFENRKIMADMQVAREEADNARRRAEHANLAKSQFLAAASHDLRQPLYALSLFSGSLKTFALTEEAHEVVGHIQNNIAALESLFNGLLDLSRLDAGAVSYVNRPFALQAVFERLTTLFAPLARDKGLTLRVLATRLWLNSDEVLLEQILMNLMSNALRYTAQGTVLLTARRRGGQVAIEVKDSGPGIDAKDQARIFEEFVQIGNTGRDKTKGLGLGLAIAARTAELLESRIELNSLPGRGSKFSLRLAVSAALLSSPSGQQEAHFLGGTKDGLHGLRLLVLEDDPAVCKSLDILLAGWGLSYLIVSTLDSGRAAMEGANFDMVLSDYRLTEGYVGLEFLTSLGARTHSPFVCLITGDVDPDVMSRALEAQIPLLYKPVHPARLRALLNHVASEL